MEYVIGFVVFFIIYRLLFSRRRTLGVVSQTTVALTKRGMGTRRAPRTFASIKKPEEEPSAEGRDVLDLLETTSANVFLTGRAGTGKSTLLRYIRATTKKNVAVLAPTGVAAINVQGQTIHSFFKFRPEITLDSVFPYRGKSRKLYQALDLLIIDEVSMVRADIFDCIEKFLRLNGPRRGHPFGGVQILLIGDLYQLPPVVKATERKIFQDIYRSPFFFDAHSYEPGHFRKFELTQVFRQKDNEFIEALDAFRMSQFDDVHIERINSRVVDAYESAKNEFSISLVPTNKMAESINLRELEKLSAPTRTYQGRITGGFKEQDLPTAQQLILKNGAQVMLLNNDPMRRWVNGDIAKVLKTDKATVRVLFDDETFEDVPENKWETVKFVIDEDTRRIRAEIIGSFSQLPLKLAWAVTIHKSQGKTFDRVHIDFGSGTFVPSQAYVALSRCRTLGGMVLSRPLRRRDVFADERVHKFMQTDERASVMPPRSPDSRTA